MAGLAGGILGKGFTAAFLGSIFTGGLGKAARGVSEVFSKDKKSLIGALIGFAAGAGMYIGFAGPVTAGTVTLMAGISGALTAKTEGGERSIQPGKAASLLGGMALGFGVVATFFALK